jgi:hypothetical protein
LNLKYQERAQQSGSGEQKHRVIRIAEVRIVTLGRMFRMIGLYGHGFPVQKCGHRETIGQKSWKI